MKETKTIYIKNIFISIVVTVLIIYFGVCFIEKIFSYLRNFYDMANKVISKMDAVVIVALISSAVSIVSVVISSIVSKIIEYRQKTKRYLYEKKEEPYMEFIEMIYNIQNQTKEGTRFSNQEMINDISSFSKKLTLWGSNKVIKKWVYFREKSLSSKESSVDDLFLLEEIVFEIRKDMGQKNRGLDKGDILSFFVNDIKKYMPKDKMQ